MDSPWCSGLGTHTGALAWAPFLLPRTIALLYGDNCLLNGLVNVCLPPLRGVPDIGRPSRRTVSAKCRADPLSMYRALAGEERALAGQIMWQNAPFTLIVAINCHDN